MNIKHFVVIGLTSIGLLSCNDDTNSTANENKETAYFSLSLSFPEAQNTKAGEPTTGDEDGDGYQTGLATEQKFQSVAVVVVKSSNNTVTDYLVYQSSDFAPGGNVAADDNSINTTSPVSKNYETLKSKLVTKGDAKVYVFLNPTADVSTEFAVGKTIANTKIEMTPIDPANITNGIAKADNFLMGNEEVPSVVTIDGTVNNPTKVTIDVERAVVKLVENTATASFDIANKPAGVTTTFKANLANFAYNNLNKRSFILKNVEQRGTAPFYGAYVIDPNFVEADYNPASPSLPWYGNDFVVIGNQGVTNGFVTTPVITYSLENTMIHDEQYQNKTTSIVYKAGLNVDGSNNQTLYTYKGKIHTTYASLKTVYDADYPGVTDALGSLFTEAELTTAYGKTGADYTTDVKAINTKLAAKGVKCYYEGVCYYNWMIKHWEQDALLGRMEFGVVRNNVYYLEVTTINNIGEPWVPGGPEDPDPTNPDPDEVEEASILVSINVLPWTVRYNHIEF